MDINNLKPYIEKDKRVLFLTSDIFRGIGKSSYIRELSKNHIDHMIITNKHRDYKYNHTANYITLHEDNINTYILRGKSKDTIIFIDYMISYKNSYKLYNFINELRDLGFTVIGFVDVIIPDGFTLV